MINVAVVGVGWAGTRHVEAIRELGHKLNVVCLVDNDPEFLQNQADELRIDRTYTHLEDALADPGIDAVSICTPHRLHAPMAIAAAQAGKHILCEKPLATTVEDATRMIDAANAAGVKLYVAENLTYAPMSRRLREIVQRGEGIGELTFASVVNGFRAPDYGYPGRRAWLAETDLGGGGTWMLHGIHSMAQLRYVFGEVETVYMREHKAASYNRRELEGTMSGLLTLTSGPTVSVIQTVETKLSHDLGGYVIHGDRGSVRAWRTGYQIFDPGQEGEPPVLDYPESDLSDYALEMEAFADYVAGAQPGPTTAESERRTLAIVQAGYESAESGEPVNLRARFGAI